MNLSTVKPVNSRHRQDCEIRMLWASVYYGHTCPLWAHVHYGHMSVMGTHVRCGYMCPLWAHVHYGHMYVMGTHVRCGYTCPLWTHVQHGHVSVMENLTKRSLFSTQRQIKQKITIELIMSCLVENILKNHANLDQIQ